jgi:hypothetical protein
MSPTSTTTGDPSSTDPSAGVTGSFVTTTPQVAMC